MAEGWVTLSDGKKLYEKVWQVCRSLVMFMGELRSFWGYPNPRDLVRTCPHLEYIGKKTYKCAFIV